METKFNETQKELLKIAKEKGFLIKEDFETYYTSPISVNNNIKRFFLLGLLKESTTFGRFEYVEVKKDE